MIYKYGKHFFVRSCLLVIISLGQVACDGLFIDDVEMVERARGYLAEDKIRAAAIELRNALQKNPENAEARFLLGSLALVYGNFGTAEKEFRRAGEVGWDAAEAQIGLGRSLLGQRKFKKLVAGLEIDDAWLPVSRANLLALRAMGESGLGDTDQSAITLAKAATLDPDGLEVLKATATLELEGGSAAQVRRTVARALDLYPENSELLLLQAGLYLQDGDSEASKKVYRRVSDADPPGFITVSGRQARLGLVRLQLLGKEYEQASTTLTPLLRRSSRDPQGNYLGAVLAFEQGNYDLAEERVLKVMEVVPGHTPSQLLFGTISFSKGGYEKAAYYLSRYVASSPDNYQARKLLGRTYILLGEHGEALKTLQPALQGTPGDADLLAMIGLSDLQRGETAAGIAGLEKAVAISPEDMAIRGDLARAYMVVGDTDRAIRELQTILKKSGHREEAEVMLVLAHLRADQFDEAISIALDMLARNPWDLAIITLVGNVFAAVGDRDEAVKYFSQALQVRPHFLPAAMALGRIEEQEGNTERAAEIYRGLVDAGVKSSDPMIALARLAKLDDDEKGMIDWLEMARQRLPEDIRSRMVLADYRLRNGELREAELVVNEAIKIAPREPVLLILRSRIFLVQENYGEALSSLNKLVIRAPDSAHVRTLLGETYYHLGQAPDARRQLEIALEKDPYFVPALVLLAELDMQSGEYERVLAYAERIQRAKPDLYIGYELAGNAAMAKRDYNMANTAYAKALEQKQKARSSVRVSRALKHTAEPGDLAIKLSESLRRTGKQDESIRPLLIWLEAHPDDHRVRNHLGSVYEATGQVDRAISEYERVLSTEAENMITLNNLAWLYLLKNDPRAIELGEKAYRKHSDEPAIQDTYGWILVQHDQAEEGRRLLEKAMEQLSGVAEVRYHYAVALYRSGDEAEARGMLEKLLQGGKPFTGREEAVRLVEDFKGRPD